MPFIILITIVETKSKYKKSYEVSGLQNSKAALHSYIYCPQSSALSSNPQKVSLYHFKNNLLLQRQIIGTKETLKKLSAFLPSFNVRHSHSWKGKQWPFFSSFKHQSKWSLNKQSNYFSITKKVNTLTITNKTKSMTIDVCWLILYT